MRHRLRLLTSGICNLRCDYCHVFSEAPKKPTGQMAPDVAIAAIDAYVAELEQQLDAGLHIEFYGGEPLTNWETVAAAVRHAEKRLGAERLSYVLNTNATLARLEHAQFCSDSDIDVHVGLDGADAVTNSSRRMQTGKTTLDRALRGIERFAAAGCRIQFNTCLTEANIDSLESLVDLACQFKVDRIYVARPDISSGAKLGGKSARNIAEILLAARVYGRSQGVEVGGPWARAILSREKFDPVPCQTPGLADELLIPHLVVDASGHAFLPPYPDNALGNIRSASLRSLLGSASYETLCNDWRTKVSSCAPCRLRASCQGYLRSLVMYHQGHDTGFEFGCNLSLNVLDAFPLAHGGDRAFSEGANLVLSRQLRAQTIDGQSVLTHQLQGHSIPVNEEDATLLRHFAHPASPAQLEQCDAPELGPVIARHLEQSVLLPECRDEEVEWLLARCNSGLERYETAHFCVFFKPLQLDAALAVVPVLDTCFDQLCTHPLPAPARQIIVYLAEGDSELAALWGASTIPAWVRGFVVARRIVVVRADCAGALTTDMQALGHELAHVFLGERRYQLPVWLEEGVCEYLAKGVYQSGMVCGGDQAVIGFAALEATGVAVLTDLDASPPADNPYYRQSWSFVSYVIEQYGADEFFRFLESTFCRDDYRAVFAEVFGSSLEVLEQKWLANSGFRRVALSVTDHLGVIRKKDRCLLFNKRYGGALRTESGVADLLALVASGTEGATDFNDSPLAQLPAGLVEQLFSRQILVANSGASVLPIDIPSAASPLPGGVANLRLNITEQCNMRCTYCYVDHAAAKSTQMDEATALRAIEQFLGLARQDRRDEVCIRFFGGEPLLNWAVIEKSLAFIDSHATDIAVRKVLNTNALNVTPEIVHTLAVNGVEIIVSVDGIGATNDLNRRLKNGKGTFERVSSNIEALLVGECMVAISLTLTESNIGQLRPVIDWVATLQERFSADIGLGVNGLSIVDFPAQPTLSDEEKVEYLIDAVHYSEEMGADLSSSKVLHDWNALLGRSKQGAYCSAVGNEITVNPQGDISPCSALRLNYGHSHDLSAALRSEEFGLMASRVSGSIPECNGCEIEAYCGGGCAADAYSRTGTPFSHDRDCTLKRSLFRRMVHEFAL